MVGSTPRNGILQDSDTAIGLRHKAASRGNSKQEFVEALPLTNSKYNAKTASLLT
jgi:hypothetical protein